MNKPNLKPDYFSFSLSKIKFNQPKKEYFTIHSFFTNDKKVPQAVFSESAGDLSLAIDAQILYCHLGTQKKYEITTLQSVFATLVTRPNVNFNINLDQFISKKLTLLIVIEQFLICFFRYRHTPLNYKQKPDLSKFFHICIQAKINEKTFKELLTSVSQKIAAVNLASDWQDSAPNKLTSESFAKEIEARWSKNSKIKFKILDRAQIEKEKMNLLLAVNAGSQFEPRLVIGEYLPKSKQPVDLVLIGKGIMFDTGGYSLKPSSYQLNMKFDMSGAASVLAAFEAIVRAEIMINVVVLTPLTDNLIGTKATLVESVIVAKDGQSVEITNTDAEGRLVLADTIVYAREHYKPREIIELSTLTGSISVSLGRETSGAFSNKPQHFAKFVKVAEKSLEPIWFLPVNAANFSRMTDSRVADLLNASASYQASSSNAAAFLFSFAKNTPFLHIDIGGTAHTKNARGQGILIQTIFNYSQQLPISKNQKN